MIVIINSIEKNWFKKIKGPQNQEFKVKRNVLKKLGDLT